MGIVQLAKSGELNWVTSDVLDVESSHNPNAERRLKVEALLSGATSKVTAGPRERERGQVVAALAFGAFDALHIACAESAGADVFLTTDDRLRRRAGRQVDKLAVRVENPVK